MNKPNSVDDSRSSLGSTDVPVKLCEGASGVWHYHLCSKRSSGLKALCGAQTMPSHAPLSSWRHKPDHMRSSYCDKCEALARAR